MSHRNQGFTLLEVMVALSIFAVIGLGSWQVLDRVLTSKQYLTQRSDQLRETQRGIWLLARDIGNIVNRPIRNENEQREAAVTSLVSGYPLTLTRGGWNNPLNEARSTLQRVGYTLEPTDSGQHTLMRHYWPVLDRAPGTEIQQQALIHDVIYFEVQFIDDKGKYLFHWPEDSGSNTEPNLEQIPAGILIRLQTEHFGELERLFALRDLKPEERTP
ncbi:MAG: type II secretion system minor pseudopilin GspJ [Porticoccaceae bacterium]|nr:type II secretion system minor pseudopilin GspJ [Porticoccaceae bacterium]